MTAPFAGRTVVVTGASSGIGRALATALVGRGAHVVAAARGREALQVLADAIGPALHPVVADVSDAAAVGRLVAAAAATGAPLLAVINNAGLGHVEPFLASDPTRWRATLDTNVIGALLVAHAFLPALLASGRGAVLNVGSASASGWPYLTLYAASKAALHAASLALDREYAGRGVRVLSVEVGPTADTGFAAHSDPAHLPAAAQAWTALDIPWRVDVRTPAESAESILAALAAGLTDQA